jgi:hypothetical protein
MSNNNTKPDGYRGATKVDNFINGDKLGSLLTHG